MKSQFSKNIRAVRNSHELTQKQLADRVGGFGAVTPGQRRWEEVHSPSTRRLSA